MTKRGKEQEDYYNYLHKKKPIRDNDKVEYERGEEE
jgi:hypothetical protein